MKTQEMLAENFVCPITVNSFCPRVPTDHVSARIQHDKGIVPHGGHHQPESFFAFSQALVLLLDLCEHLVESIGQQTQLILAFFSGPHGIVPPSSNRLGGLSRPVPPVSLQRLPPLR